MHLCTCNYVYKQSPAVLQQRLLHILHHVVCVFYLSAQHKVERVNHVFNHLILIVLQILGKHYAKFLDFDTFPLIWR